MAGSLLLHNRKNLLGQEKCPFRIDIHGVVKILFCHLEERLESSYTRIVDKAVNVAKPFHDHLDKVSCGFCVSNIGFSYHCFRSQITTDSCDLFKVTFGS